MQRRAALRKRLVLAPVAAERLALQDHTGFEAMIGIGIALDIVGVALLVIGIVLDVDSGARRGRLHLSSRGLALDL